LPPDAFYGVYHQAGAERATSGGNNVATMSNMKSKAANDLIKKFLPMAVKELGPKASAKHVRARAIGMAMDAGTWSLPARPFIMYQESDIPKMEAIFAEWMTERARRSGRFTDRA
jgi:hypothetical protein